MRVYSFTISFIVEADDEREAKETLANALAVVEEASNDRVRQMPRMGNDARRPAGED